jgi:MFS family permease
MLHFFYSLMFGFIIDNLGVKRSLIVGNVFMILARLTLVYTTSKVMCIWVLFVILPMGTSLGIPVMSIAIRRYTTIENRHIAYDLFYICLNFAAAVAAPAIDAVRVFYNEEAVGMSAYKFLVLTGAIATVLSLGICLFLPKFDQLNEPKKASPWKIIKEIAPLSKFRRFSLLIILMTGLKMTFRHLDATFPSYMVREFGSDVLFGTIIGLQPLIIIIGLTLVAPLLVKYDSYNLISIGAYFTAAAPFVLTIEEASFPMTFLFIVVLSTGEILWSPRLYEYANSIAEEGREGTYTALANLPMFAATLFSGEMSGWLLANYCPAYGKCNGRIVWGVIGVFALTSPLLISLLKPCIYNKSDFYGFNEKYEAIEPGISSPVKKALNNDKDD